MTNGCNGMDCCECSTDAARLRRELAEARDALTTVTVELVDACQDVRVERFTENKINAALKAARYVLAKPRRTP